MNEGEPLSLKVISKILNDMNYSKVSIFDPHSEVSLALINHCESISNYKFVSLSLQDFYKAKDISKDAMLISPDSGALKKIYKLATQLNLPYVVECSKKRDTLTGKLSGFSANVHDLSDKDCFIIDDICDGGGTFIGLADVLRSKNAKSVNLILTHGIFSKGISLQGINKIYTTNSFKDIPINDTLHCFNVCTQIF
jgi:ribose-phosphate pyrophosphokinase